MTLLAVAAFALGASVHLGWLITALSGVRVGGLITTMNPTIALCFEISAVSLGLGGLFNRRRIARILAAGVLSVGLSKILDLYAGTSLCPETFLVPEKILRAGYYPGHISPSVAACFCVIGTALLTFDLRWWPAPLHPQVLMTGVTCVGLAVLTGYAYESGGLYGLLPMAIPTALGFLPLGVGTILSRPGQGFLAGIPQGSPGARIFSRLLPACLLTPLLLGWLTLVGAGKEWLNGAANGLAVAAVLTALVLSVMVYLVSKALNRSDDRRRAAEAALDQRNRTLEQEILVRIEAEERAAHIATHDSLTGLPNRLLFLDRLGNATRRASRQAINFTLLYIDLDRFKPVNDRYGHNAGDVLLKDVAARLALGVRDVDMVARLGGDEFGAILEGPVDEEGALMLARRLLASASQPYRLIVPGLGDVIEVSIGVSIGIALFPDHAATLEDLVRVADAAMYRAKAAGEGVHIHMAAACRV